MLTYSYNESHSGLLREDGPILRSGLSIDVHVQVDRARGLWGEEKMHGSTVYIVE